MRFLLGLAFVLVSVELSSSASDVVEFSDPSYVERYHVLIKRLRCPKCQNQNLADSDAPISRDLRAQVQQLLEDGLSDDEIKQYLADRYSAFILYEPEVNRSTYALWFSPLIILVVGFFVVIRLIKGSPSKETADTPVIDQDQLTSLLDDGDSQR